MGRERQRQRDRESQGIHQWVNVGHIKSNLSIYLSIYVKMAIASASAFKYKYCLLHSCKCLVLTD